MKDGSNRVIFCTLNFGFIPKQFEKSINKLLTEIPPDADIMPIWDITEGKWKSFRISKMHYFITSDEFKDENKAGQSTDSNIGKTLKQRKDKEAKEFEKRIKDLKQKAQEAKENINGVNNNEKRS